MTGRCGSGSVRMWVDACYVAVVVTVMFHCWWRKCGRAPWRRVKAQEACATFFCSKSFGPALKKSHDQCWFYCWFEINRKIPRHRSLLLPHSNHWPLRFFFSLLNYLQLDDVGTRKSTSMLLSGCHHTSPTQTQLDEIVSRLQVRFLLPSLEQRWLTVSIYDSSERELGHLRHFGHHYWTLIVTRISNRATWKQKTWPVSRCVGGTASG